MKLEDLLNPDLRSIFVQAIRRNIDPNNPADVDLLKFFEDDSVYEQMVSMAQSADEVPETSETDCPRGNFVERFQARAAANLLELPTPMLVMSCGAGAIRLTQTLVTLLRFRNAQYTDDRSLTGWEAFGHVLTLMSAASGLYFANRELTRRLRGAPASPLVLQQAAKLKAVPQSEEAVGLATTVALAAAALVEALRGRTLIKHRALSSYGRAYQLALTSVVAVQAAEKASRSRS